jgi:glycosyltransferase involved in cell wall biosynthesis
MTIKVLHLIDSGGLYGAEVMLLNLVEEQIKTGLNPLILSIGTPDIEEKQLEAEARKRNLPIIPFRMKAGMNLSKGLDIVKYSVSEGFDILHSHGYKFNILLGCLPGRIRKIPLVSTVHGYVHAPLFSKMWFYQKLDLLCLRRLDGVVFVSNVTKKIANIKLAQSTVINNGIDLSVVDDAPIENQENSLEPMFTSSNLLVGVFGRLTKEKGFEYLIAAFKNVLQVVPESMLIIWGEGYLKEDLEKIVSDNGLEERVIFPGYTAYVNYFLKKIDVLVIPSLTEGLPIILLEAMKNKVPIIATSVGGIPEVLDYDRCGVLVPARDVSTLARAIINAHENVNDGDIRTRHAYERVSAHYSRGVMTKRYADLYQRILSMP